MPTNFSDNQNKQKYLIVILIVVVLATIFMLRKNIFKSSVNEAVVPETFLRQNIEINFKIFEDETLKNLQLPEAEKPYAGEVGRKNPFISY